MALLRENQFIRFVLVGGLNTIFGYSIFALLVLTGLHYTLAVGVATVAGVLFNFKTTGMLVFRSADNRRIVRFVGVYLVVYALNIAVIRVATLFDIEVLLAGALAIVPVALLSYTMNRVFVFGVAE